MRSTWSCILINDHTGVAKLIWPSIAVKSNIVSMQEGKFKFTGDLKRHYDLIISFMMRVCKNWWPNDLAQLSESFRVVRDYQTNDIISRRYVCSSKIPKVQENNVQRYHS